MTTITPDILTLPATNGGKPRVPVEGFVELVNAVINITKTEFKDWSFTGQENTKAVANGYFSGLYTGKVNGWRGFGFKFDMATGLFHVDAKQAFSTDAKGFVWWFENGYGEQQKGRVCEVNPELIQKSKPLPRKYGLSLSAKKSLLALVSLVR